MISRAEAMLVVYEQETMLIYRIFPAGASWWSMSKEPCKFTGFPSHAGGMSKDPCKDFPNKSKVGGYAVSVTNDAVFQIVKTKIQLCL